MTNHEAISDHEALCKDLASYDWMRSRVLTDYSTEVAGSAPSAFGVVFYITDSGDRVHGNPWRFWMVSREGVKEFTP
jgi:hypothetical protein